jgi:hypothetical protein
VEPYYIGLLPGFWHGYWAYIEDEVMRVGRYPLEADMCHQAPLTSAEGSRVKVEVKVDVEMKTGRGSIF